MSKFFDKLKYFLEMKPNQLNSNKTSSRKQTDGKKSTKDVGESRKNQPKSDNKINWCLYAGIILLTFATRYYKVTEPDHVCWDETHFGKMGSWYINRTFFFDVHPPLGKMLIALSGALTGYNGTYPFEKPGEKYNETAYEGMRIFCTTLGALIVPMTYTTVWDLTESNMAALISSAYILFDVGMITLNQYILLDPILLFFMTASVMGMVKVSKTTIEQKQTFSCRWWWWLFFTGAMLACTMSVKFVGLFVIMLVGLHTINDLWIELGDLSKPVIEIVKQFVGRAIALIIWPIILYTCFFYIHLTVLHRSGSGDGHFSSAFQSQLIGNSLYDAKMPRQVAYGAVITVKNQKTGGGYLHSHGHLYPEGMGAVQQQITTYSHKDDNNKWLIKPHDRELKSKESEIELVKNGDLVRLEHIATKRNLHSHRIQAPLTKKHYQVTGYGQNGEGDTNDIWKVVIVGGGADEEIETAVSKILFVHHLQNCALTTSGKQLPKWAFEQQEVTCTPNLRDKNAYWNIEDNIFERLPNVSFREYAPGFLSRFMESHAVMIQGNAGLKPKEGEVTSRPWQWPIDYKGQWFSGGDFKVYLLGNPVVWWSNLVFLAAFVFMFIVSAAKEERGYTTTTDVIDETKWRSLKASAWLFVGWLLHYVPFWAMGRVLYYHHYFPASVFNSMLTGPMLNYLIQRLPKWMQHAILGATLGIVFTACIWSHRTKL